MRKLCAIRLEKDALACSCSHRRDIRGASIEILHYAQRSEPRTTARGKHLEPPTLFLSDVRPRNVEAEIDSTRALEMNEHGIFHPAGTRTIHVRRHANRLGKVSEPQSEIEQWITMLEKSSATRFGLSESPSLLRTFELI